ncbi:hypothetical protein ACWDPI_08125, partial [Streptomyces zhihengii]
MSFSGWPHVPPSPPRRSSTGVPAGTYTARGQGHARAGVNRPPLDVRGRHAARERLLTDSIQLFDHLGTHTSNLAGPVPTADLGRTASRPSKIASGFTVAIGAGQNPDLETAGAHTTTDVVFAAPAWTLE